MEVAKVIADPLDLRNETGEGTQDGIGNVYVISKTSGGRRTVGWKANINRKIYGAYIDIDDEGWDKFMAAVRLVLEQMDRTVKKALEETAEKIG